MRTYETIEIEPFGEIIKEDRLPNGTLNHVIANHQRFEKPMKFIPKYGGGFLTMNLIQNNRVTYVIK